VCLRGKGEWKHPFAEGRKSGEKGKTKTKEKKKDKVQATSRPSANMREHLTREKWVLKGLRNHLGLVQVDPGEEPSDLEGARKATGREGGKKGKDPAVRGHGGPGGGGGWAGIFLLEKKGVTDRFVEVGGG